MRIQRYKHDIDYSYALGMALTIELLKAKPDLAEFVYLSEKAKANDNISFLTTLCREHNVAYAINEKAFNILSPKGNCFVIGKFKKFDSFLDKGNHIVMVNPSDSGNLGTILRTATGFGIKNIAIIRPAVDIFDPKTVRASMGAIFHMNFKYYDDYHQYEIEYPNQIAFPFMLKANESIHYTIFKEPFSLIFGNEATGLPDSFAKLENVYPVVIPHTSDIDSLNLTMAVGIALFQATKDKWR